MSVPVCKRGEVWMVNFNPGRGREQKGIRPAMVLQNDVGNQHAATTIVAAVTSTVKKYPVTVPLDPHEGGLKQPYMINLAQILTIDKCRLKKKIGILVPEKILQVENGLKISLGLM